LKQPASIQHCAVAPKSNNNIEGLGCLCAKLVVPKPEPSFERWVLGYDSFSIKVLVLLQSVLDIAIQLISDKTRKDCTSAYTRWCRSFVSNHSANSFVCTTTDSSYAFPRMKMFWTFNFSLIWDSFFDSSRIPNATSESCFFVRRRE
jgi:hypothetical protein